MIQPSVQFSSSVTVKAFAREEVPNKRDGVVLINLGEYAALDISEAHSQWKMRDLATALVQGYIVKNWSTRFQEFIYYVPRTEHIPILRPLLPKGTVVYALHELRLLGSTVPRSPSFDLVHEVKKQLNAVIKSITPTEEKK